MMQCKLWITCHWLILISCLIWCLNCTIVWIASSIVYRVIFLFMITKLSLYLAEMLCNFSFPLQHASNFWQFFLDSRKFRSEIWTNPFQNAKFDFDGTLWGEKSDWKEKHNFNIMDILNQPSNQDGKKPTDLPRIKFTIGQPIISHYHNF